MSRSAAIRGQNGFARVSSNFAKGKKFLDLGDFAETLTRRAREEAYRRLREREAQRLTREHR